MRGLGVFWFLAAVFAFAGWVMNNYWGAPAGLFAYLVFIWVMGDKFWRRLS